jgi:hypothetical protein
MATPVFFSVLCLTIESESGKGFDTPCPVSSLIEDKISREIPMISFRAEVDLHYAGTHGELLPVSNNVENFTAENEDAARDLFFDIIRKFITKNGHPKDQCFKARLYVGGQSIHEINSCSEEILSPERRAASKKLFADWEEYKKKNLPLTPLQQRMQSGGG